jgi:hypothetical protein
VARRAKAIGEDLRAESGRHRQAGIADGLGRLRRQHAGHNGEGGATDHETSES